MTPHNTPYTKATTSTHTIGTINLNPEETFDNILNTTQQNYLQGKSSRTLANTLFARAHGITTPQKAQTQPVKPVSLNTPLNDTVAAYISVADYAHLDQAKKELTNYVHNRLTQSPRKTLRIALIVGYDNPTVFQLRYKLGFANSIDYRVETWDFKRLATGTAFAVGGDASARAQETVIRTVEQHLRKEYAPKPALSHTTLHKKTMMLP